MNLAPQSPTNDLMDRLEAIVATLGKDKAKRASLRKEIASATFSDTQQISSWVFSRDYKPSADKYVALKNWLDEKMLGLSPKEKASFKGFLATVKKTRRES